MFFYNQKLTRSDVPLWKNNDTCDN